VGEVSCTLARLGGGGAGCEGEDIARLWGGYGGGMGWTLECLCVAVKAFCRAGVGVVDCCVAEARAASGERERGGSEGSEDGGGGGEATLARGLGM
jgi:hypothetical protein